MFLNACNLDSNFIYEALDYFKTLGQPTQKSNQIRRKEEKSLLIVATTFRSDQQFCILKLSMLIITRHQ